MPGSASRQGPNWWQAPDGSWYPPDTPPFWPTTRVAGTSRWQAPDGSWFPSQTPPFVPAPEAFASSSEVETRIVELRFHVQATNPQDTRGESGNLVVTNWRAIMQPDRGRERFYHGEICYGRPFFKRIQAQMQEDYWRFRKDHPETDLGRQMTIGVGFPGLGLALGHDGLRRMRQTDLVHFDGGRHRRYWRYGIPTLVGLRAGKLRDTRKGIRQRDVVLSEVVRSVPLTDADGRHVENSLETSMANAIHVASHGAIGAAIRAARSRTYERWRLTMTGERDDVERATTYLEEHSLSPAEDIFK